MLVVIPRFEIAAVSLDRFCLSGRPQQLEQEAIRDCARDLILNPEELGTLLVEALRPDLSAVGRPDQLHRNPQAPTRGVHAAAHDVAHLERIRNALQIVLPAFERECRSPRNHGQTRNPGKRVDDLVRQPFSQMLVAAILAQALEWQYGHRRWTRNGLDEAVTPLRDRLDEFFPPFVLPQYLPQSRDVNRQVALFHDLFGPHHAEQFLFADNLSRIADEHRQNLESLRRSLRRQNSHHPPLARRYSRSSLNWNGIKDAL